jgi:hypothetical protein
MLYKAHRYVGTIWNWKSCSFSLESRVDEITEHSTARLQPQQVSLFGFRSFILTRLAVYFTFTVASVRHELLLVVHFLTGGSALCWLGRGRVTSPWPSPCLAAHTHTHYPTLWLVRYLRKYQASRMLMTSSTEKTSTVGRMWELWDFVSSGKEREEGRGRGYGRQTKSVLPPKVCTCSPPFIDLWKEIA